MVEDSELGNTGPTCSHKRQDQIVKWRRENRNTVIVPGMFIKKEFTEKDESTEPDSAFKALGMPPHVLAHFNQKRRKREHMWVEVTGEGTGTLANMPALLRMLPHQQVTWKWEEIQDHTDGK